MSGLRREREPQFESAQDVDEGAESSSIRPRRRRSLFSGLLVAVALGACGVGGYFLADSVYLASQRLAPASQVAVTPVDPAATSPVPAAPSDATKPGNQASVLPSAPLEVATPTGRRIGNWTLVCPGTNAPRTDCALVQRLVDTQKRPVLVWSVTRDSDGTVRAMWQTPVDVDRKRGLVLDAGDGKPRSVPFAGCAEQYCLVRGILAPNYLPTLAASGRITVSVSNAGGQVATHAFASTGLADGLAWLGGGQ